MSPNRPTFLPGFLRPRFFLFLWLLSEPLKFRNVPRIGGLPPGRHYKCVACTLGSMYDLTTLLKVLDQYFSGATLLVMTLCCWRLDRRGRASKVLRASYAALAFVLLLVMALPLAGGVRTLP